MQTILTKYRGPTNTKPSKMIATASGHSTGFAHMQVIMSYDDALSSAENHKEIAYRLIMKLDWKGQYRCGDTKQGKVWVRITNQPEDSITYS